MSFLFYRRESNVLGGAPNLPSRKSRIPFIAGGSFLFAIFVLYIFMWRSPHDFGRERIVTIKDGSTLSEIAEFFEKEKIVRSSFWFKSAIVVFRGERKAVSGSYYFNKPQNVLSVALRVARGDHRLSPVRVTFPEGASAKEMGRILKANIASFETDRFVVEAVLKEGYLFPDTYFFMPNQKIEEIIEIMKDNFESKISLLEKEIISFDKPLQDIIIMASLVEEEARTMETRRIIAGILWKRLNMGIPLQVDATFPYFLGKSTYELKSEDLLIDSPYNTYKYKGLPIGPITNPGLDSIRAVLTPVKTPYLYYLSDRSGKMYYGRTLDEHTRNKDLYLNKN